MPSQHLEAPISGKDLGRSQLPGKYLRSVSMLCLLSLRYLLSERFLGRIVQYTLDQPSHP